MPIAEGHCSGINFFSEEISFTLRKKNLVRKWIAMCVKKEKKTFSGLNFIFCSDGYLLRMNKKYLRHNFFTDVITFDNSTEKKIISGDVFISIDRVKENAKTWSVPFGEELHRVMVHGVLHLLGYKDKTVAQQKIIRRKENTCLSLRKKAGF